MSDEGSFRRDALRGNRPPGAVACDEGDQQRRGRPENARDRANLAPRSLERRIEQRLSVLPLPAKERRVEARRAGKVHFAVSLRDKIPLGPTYFSFFLAVLLPIIFAAIYYGLIASNQYAAEFRFAVKDTAPSPTSMGTSITTLLGGGSGSSALENYMVADYLTSRQAVEELQRRIDIKAMYSKSGVDWWARFNSNKPMENFLSYWQKMVTSDYDIVTGIATAKIRAFSPDDALLIANTLVKLSEELVNGIANRANVDAVRFAEGEVERAQDRLKTVRSRLTAYRNKVGVIDPTSSVVASNSTVQQSLQSNLSVLETQLTSLLNRNLSPSSPAVQTLQNQIKAVKEQLTAVEGSVAAGKDRAGGGALSSVIGEYEQLEMERQFSQALVTSAMQALEQARALASSQHLYITPYVRPSLPESSTYPRRLVSIFVVGLMAFGIWTIGLLTVRSIRERFG